MEQEEELPEIETLENKERQIVVYKPPNSCSDDAAVGMEMVAVSEVEGVVVLPSIGAYSVQCAMCYKWRFIPSKDKYQEIREHVVEQPFTCDLVREWRPEITCDDPSDIEPDGSRLWAIDKPSIAQPPPGWDRQLRIRAQGSFNFADVYYISPKGKRLRSMVEVHKYLMKHPEYERGGVTLSQFSFKTPRPLQKNYTRKWSPPFKPSHCETAQDNPRALPAGESSFKEVTIPRKKRSRPAEKNTSSSDSMYI